MVKIKLKNGGRFDITEYTYSDIQRAMVAGKVGFKFLHFPKEKLSVNVDDIIYIWEE